MNRKQVALKIFKEGAGSLTPSECVALIEDLLLVLAYHGYFVRDYDDKARTLYGIRTIRGKLYFLAGDDSGGRDGNGGTL